MKLQPGLHAIGLPPPQGKSVGSTFPCHARFTAKYDSHRTRGQRRKVGPFQSDTTRHWSQILSPVPLPAGGPCLLSLRRRNHRARLLSTSFTGHSRHFGHCLRGKLPQGADLRCTAARGSRHGGTLRLFPLRNRNPVGVQHRAQLHIRRLCDCCDFSPCLRARKPTAETIFGALCIYLMVGFTFARLYAIIATVRPHAFYLDPATNSHSLPVGFDFIFFSFGTMTSLGAAGIVAVSPAGALRVRDGIDPRRAVSCRDDL